ncbi:MAG TPA: glycosyl transferase, partial [Firmicutes bacterium]|nr:glycosyl transferase [Bacillota bacterium]
MLNKGLSPDKHETVFHGSSGDDGGSFGTKRAPQVKAFPAVSKLGQQLLDAGLINTAQLEYVLQFQKTKGGRLGDILVSLGMISQSDFEKIIIPERRKLPLGEMLLQEGVIEEVQLKQALSFQEKSGGLLGDILITLGMAKPEAVYRELATQNQIGRVGMMFDFQEAQKLPYAIAKKYQVCVINHEKSRYLVAALHKLLGPETAEIESFLDMKIEVVLAEQHEMENFWKIAYDSDLVDESINRLRNEMAENSAQETFTRSQKIILIGLGALMGLGLVFNFTVTLILINVIIQGLYFLISTHKMYILTRGINADSQIKISEQEVQALDERELPIYTILVPIYKEAGVIKDLLDHLDKLDYPKTKLDVRLLLEEVDLDTIQAVQSYQLPYYCTALTVPSSQPQTKPKACNYGLIRARGKYVVIYDAEDRPELDQLKKAYLAFKQLSDQYICVQAKLNYYNCDDNLLTKWFTQEYSMWFELLLPGISKMKIPVPLGGT